MGSRWPTPEGAEGCLLWQCCPLLSAPFAVGRCTRGTGRPRPCFAQTSTEALTSLPCSCTHRHCCAPHNLEGEQQPSPTSHQLLSPRAQPSCAQQRSNGSKTTERPWLGMQGATAFPTHQPPTCLPALSRQPSSVLCATSASCASASLDSS